MVELIDLSGYVEEDQPVFPGNQRTKFLVSSTHEESGYTGKQQVGKETGAIERKLKAKKQGSTEEHLHIRTLLLSEHGPTHIDSISHLDPTSEKSIEEIPLERFYTEAVGIDLTDVPAAEFITIEDLTEELDTHGLELQEGDAILLHTGHRAENYSIEDHEKRYRYLHEYTGLNRAAADWLAEQGVSNIGVDAPSIDHGTAGRTQEFPAHDMCAEHEILNMENMANLDAVVGERFRLAAFPLKLRDGTGSPIRPVAILDG